MSTEDISDNTIITDISDNTITTDISDNTIITDISDNTIITDISDNTIITDISDNTVTTDISDNTITTDISDNTIIVEPPPPPPPPLPPVTLEDISNNTVFQFNITGIQVLPVPYNSCDISQCIYLNNVVNLVNWQYVGNYRDKNIELTGSSQLPPPNLDDFVEYQNLSKEEVVQWVTPQINVNDYQQNIINQIYIQYFPPQTVPPLLPWS
jgi:hypothetical protein